MAVEEEERRINPWDGGAYTLEELRKVLKRADFTEQETLDHWHNQCRPLAMQSDGAAAVAEEAPQVKAWRQMWTFGSLSAVWTSADMGHIHAVTGAAYMLLGAIVLADFAMHDMAVLGGEQGVSLMPQELAYLALFLGVANALSGLQPRLLNPAGGVAEGLGLGSKTSSTRSGGFANCSAFFLVLAYQCVRALPSFPDALTILDPVVALTSVLTMLHTAFILDSWIKKGSIHRIDALLLPNILNLPVAWQLLTSGGVFVEKIAAAHPGWPEFFFSANFTLAWALSAVTFVLSLAERKVLSREVKGLLMLCLPFATVAAVLPLRTMVLIPEWMQTDMFGMLLLNVH